jgi:UDP-3-O-[3-hydroxymyristoyl] N-acetylglucosamine deacetylase
MLKYFGISGKECEVEAELLCSNAACSKIIWFCGEKNPNDFKVIYQGRTSVLMHGKRKKIIGAEHLSAAALAFSGCQFKLNLPQSELPLLDGSAKPWEMELEKVGGTKQEALRFYNIAEKEFEIKMDTRFVKFQQTEDENCLEVKYTIDRFGQKFFANVKICSAKNLEKIFLARSYIFAEELPNTGFSENLQDCGIVLNRESNDLRFENEPAYHKILDFLGDMALYAGFLPSGKFEIFNGGHELHHKVLERFRAEQVK